jgi:hypothetical protein
MTNSHSRDDFQRGLPSPLKAVRALRADAQDSVVALGAQTESQGIMYVVSRLDTAITELAKLEPPPHAIFVTGSAGGGKSGAAEYQRRENPHLFSDIVEDATHSDDPSEDQAATLASRLALLRDDSPERPARPILVAANIGMILQLASAWKKEGAQFDALIAQLFELVGLPGAPPPRDDVLPLHIRVLNLDDRPTTGPHGLLNDMLDKLLPADSETVFEQSRCGSCRAISYCPARANAILISTVGRMGLADLVDRAAVVRGRQDTPRALWDFVSKAVLPESHYSDFEDPCDASADARDRQDSLWVLTGLLPISQFQVDSDLGRRIAALDPARQPTRRAYEAFANAGLAPAEDSSRVNELDVSLPVEHSEQPVLRLISDALRDGSPATLEELEWRDSIARLHLGLDVVQSKLLQQLSEEDAPFLQTLEGYRAWQALESGSSGNETGSGAKLIEDLGDQIERIVSALTNGLAHMFGQRLDDKLFLPVQNYDPRQTSRAFVHYDRRTMSAKLIRDSAVTANPDGAVRIGYRPLAITLELACGNVQIDLPTYRLLTTRRVNLMGGGEDAERTFALRRAAEGIALIAAQSDEVTMLVTDPATGLRYRVTTETTTVGNKEILHALAVSK